MNVVEELKRLKDAHDERKKGCVAYAKDSKGNKYYAINGEEYFNSNGRIEEVIGDHPVFCSYRWAYTVLDPATPDAAISYGYKFYKLLKMGPNSLGFRKIDHKEFVNPKGNEGYEGKERFFHCAEKKIIGYAEEFGVTVKEMFSTKEPCYHCLPEIETVYYAEKNKMKQVVKEKLLSEDDGITTYKYRLYSL